MGTRHVKDGVILSPGTPSGAVPELDHRRHGGKGIRHRLLQLHLSASTGWKITLRKSRLDECPPGPWAVFEFSSLNRIRKTLHFEETQLTETPVEAKSWNRQCFSTQGALIHGGCSKLTSIHGNRTGHHQVGSHPRQEGAVESGKAAPASVASRVERSPVELGFHTKEQGLRRSDLDDFTEAHCRLRKAGSTPCDAG